MLLIFILVFAAICAVSILAVMFVKNCTAKEATQTVKKFLKEVFETLFNSEQPQQPAIYPTLVGYDGYRVVPQLVDAEFEKIRKNFSTCFCTDIHYNADGSFIVYQFDILRKPDSLDDETLSIIIQKQAEEILVATMRRYDCYLPAEPLTVVELLPNMLHVAFARNDAGIRALDVCKRNIRKRKILSGHPAGDTMKERW